MIFVLTTADTEILALRLVVDDLPAGFPAVRAANPANLAGPPSLVGVELVLVRLLGGRAAWPPFDDLRRACLAAGTPLLAFGGEAGLDAELAAASTVPPATVTRAFEYLSQGGLGNAEQLLRFLTDTLLGTSFGFEPPAAVPAFGIWRDRTATVVSDGRPVIGIVFYRAHLISGNTQFVDDLCTAIEARDAKAVPVWCYSLRPESDGRTPALDILAREGVDVIVTTVLAMGRSGPSERDTQGRSGPSERETQGRSEAAGADVGWDVTPLAELGVPVLQAIASMQPSERWEANAAGLEPLDVALSVAIPEFDGRIVGVPFSFKEIVDDGADLGSPVTAYRARPDRTERVAGQAVRLGRLRHIPVAEKRVALVLSAYPTKRSRLGNAVGLDTPASVIDLLHVLRRSGYRVDRIPASGDDLMGELADGLAYEPEAVTSAETPPAGRWAGPEYAAWFRTLPPEFQAGVVEAWGEPPGSLFLDGSDLIFCGLDLGGVLVAVQPPRGFGENPVAVYHSPDLAPTHHYLAFYRWLERVWEADAVVHVGKHGTLEWLPGKGVGLSSGCAPDAALGDLPLVYPFVVNDPGEGAQAKRRAHAVVVDHLVPPLTRADTYDDVARLETLLDEHARIAALDPAKLPAIRAQVWELLVAAEIHRDLGLGDVPTDDAFDELILEVDGYLCELKDAQIRGGLHVLGRCPEGEAELDLVTALTRVPQGGVPSLRATVAADLAIDLEAGRRTEVDAVEAECRRRLGELQAQGWPAGAPDPTLRWVGERLVPALRRTPDEVANVLNALDGRFVPPGPSGAPSRGMANVLPTGRNFYTVDPRAVPSPLAWEVGKRLAEALLERHRRDEGREPESVGLVVWGTAAMRTSGDDVAEALALLGVRPVWAEESGRVTGIEAVPLAELGRPRIDVIVRISGFFRDAFPHLVHLLDEAVALVAGLDEPPESNFIRAHGTDDPRIYGAKPGAYGSGILPLLESQDWRSDEDLAAVYLAWGGYSYGRAGMGVPAQDAMRRTFAGIDVAVKNQDNREHDIFDSDDYLQDHGGMIATVRALRGEAPKALFGDSSDPARPRVRSLGEEAARVVRTRVLNPKWISAMGRHGYKGAFEMAATVDYLFGYDATAHVAEDWMYERVTAAYVADPDVRKFFQQSNPWALRHIAERLLEAHERGMWDATDGALATLRAAVLEAEGWEEGR